MTGANSPQHGKPAIPGHDLLRHIGSGSYGEVWLARNDWGKLRAVKVIYRRTFANDQGHFEREFNGIQRYEEVCHTHSSLMPIHQVGRNKSEGFFYYVMELADDAEGAHTADSPGYRPKTLAYVLSEVGQRCRIPTFDCVRIGIELATGLEQLHRSRLVHRDIKPSNIIFVHDVAKLADIGLVTESGVALSYVGTEGYIPPEGPGHFPADIYSLGRVLYEMAMGRDRLEFPALPAMGSLTQTEQQQIRELNAIILKACDENPKERHASVGALRDELERVRTGQSIERLRKLERRLKQTKEFAIVASAVALLAGVGFAGWWLYWTGKVSGLRNGQRDVLLNEARALRVAPLAYVRNFGWASNALERALRAGRIAMTNDVLDEVAATFAGLDARLVYSGVGRTNSASSFAFDAAGRRLLIGGSSNRAALSSTRVLDLGTFDTPSEVGPAADGPVAWGAAGLPSQLTWSEGTPVLVDLRTGRARQFMSLFATGANVHPVPLAMTEDGSWLAAGFCDGKQHGCLAVWPADTLAPHTSADLPVSALAFSSDGALLGVGTAEGMVKVWRVEDFKTPRVLQPGRPLASFTTDGIQIDSLAFGRDMTVRLNTNAGPAWMLAAGDAGGTVTIWELAMGHQRAVLRGSQYNVNALAFSPDGVVLASGGRTELHLWAVASGREVLRIGPPTFRLPIEYITALAFSPDGRFLASGSPAWSSRPSQTHLFELEWSRGGVKPLHGLSAVAEHVWWSQDSKLVAALAHNWKLAVWEVSTGRLIRLFETPEGRFADNAAAAFSPDGTQLAFATGSEARLWKLPSGKLQRTWRLPDGLGDWMNFTTNGQRLLLLRRELPEGSSKEIQWRLRDLLTSEGEKPILQDTNRLLLDSDMEKLSTTNLTYYTAYMGEVPAHGRFFLRADHWRRGTNSGWYARVVDTDTGGTLWKTESSIPTRSSFGCRLDPTGHILAYAAPSGESVLVKLPEGREIRREKSLGVFNTPLTWWVARGENFSGLNDGALLQELGGRRRHVTLGLGTGTANHTEMSPDGRMAAWGSSSGIVLVADIERVWDQLAELGLQP